MDTDRLTEEEIAGWLSAGVPLTTDQKARIKHVSEWEALKGLWDNGPLKISLERDEDWLAYYVYDGVKYMGRLADPHRGPGPREGIFTFYSDLLTIDEQIEFLTRLKAYLWLNPIPW